MERESRCLHLSKGRSIVGVFRAHVEAVVDRNLVVLVDKIIAADIVGGYGS